MAVTPRPYMLAETTWKTVKETDYQVSILPWGATEAHNYHLPYGTDIILTEHVAAEAARLAWERGARVIVLPCIPFGVNTGQLDIRLTINLNPSSQATILETLCTSDRHVAGLPERRRGRRGCRHHYAPSPPSPVFRS